MTVLENTAVNTMSPPTPALKKWQYPCQHPHTSLHGTNSCLARAWEINKESKGREARSHLRNKQDQVSLHENDTCSFMKHAYVNYLTKNYPSLVGEENIH